MHFEMQQREREGGEGGWPHFSHCRRLSARFFVPFEATQNSAYVSAILSTTSKDSLLSFPRAPRSAYLKRRRYNALHLFWTLAASCSTALGLGDRNGEFRAIFRPHHRRRRRTSQPSASAPLTKLNAILSHATTSIRRAAHTEGP